MAKLYFRYGSMNCGKSTLLLQIAHNYEEKGFKILLIKPSIDTKGNAYIINRSNLSHKVDILLKENDLVSNYLSPNLQAILIDEAQFLTKKQVDDLYYITKIKDIPVLCFGLRCDFKMLGFSGSTRLLQIADTIEEIKNICKCGKKATQNIRLINGIPNFTGKKIQIDNNDLITYESVCGKCYLEIKQNGGSHERRNT